MDQELTKSLNDLIDETLSELEELRKSRFSASEIKIEGPGAHELDGKPVNGSLDKEEDKKEDEKDEDKDEDKKDMEKGVLDEAEDKKVIAHKVEKEESCKPEDMDKKEDKKEEDKDEDKEDEEKEEKSKKLFDMHKMEMKKSMDEVQELYKSYVDDKIKPLEQTLGSILEMVNKLADQPVAPKGVTSRGPAPLMKSIEAVEPLSKAEVASKLIDLKKSGTRVDSMDVIKAEMGQDLQTILQKYNLN